jgi:hypothetical protein
MSQTAVNDEPAQAYEGKLDVSGQFPSTRISRAASELIYFGKLVVPIADDDLAVGDQSVQLPTSAAEILSAKGGGGVAVADPSQERLLVSGVPAAYGAYPDESMVQVLRKGRIWVVTETAIAGFTDGVYVRFQDAGVTPPTEQLGSFTGTNEADTEPAPEGFAWVGSASIGGIDFGLLSVNLPA